MRGVTEKLVALDEWYGRGKHLVNDPKKKDFLGIRLSGNIGLQNSNSDPEEIAVPLLSPSKTRRLDCFVVLGVRPE